MKTNSFLNFSLKIALTALTISLSFSGFSQACECTDYVYLPDFNSNIIHKYTVEANGDLTEIGSPWATTVEPHGLIIHPNGNIGTTDWTTNQTDLLSCNGELLDTDILPFNGSFNTVSNGDILYIVVRGDYCKVQAFDMCSNYSLIGEVPLSGDCTFANWGITLSPDGSTIYVTDNYFSGDGNGDVFVLNSDLSNFTTPATVTATPIISGLNDLFGVATDSQGNIYVVEHPNGSDATFLNKYDSNGNLLCSISDTSDDNPPSGFWNGWGIALNETNGIIYMSSFSEDCIAAISTGCPMTYLGPAVDYVPNTSAKGIRLYTECCPVSDAVTADITECVPAGAADVAIADLIDCDGTICEGNWQVVQANAALTLNDCNNTIEVSGSGGCAEYSLVSDGTANNLQCGAFSITLNVCIYIEPETPAISVTDNDCAADAPGAFSVVTDCGAGSTLEWSTDGGASWSATAPVYGENAVTVRARCISDTETTCLSAETADVTSAPGVCCPQENCVNEYGEFTIAKRRP